MEKCLVRKVSLMDEIAWIFSSIRAVATQFLMRVSAENRVAEPMAINEITNEKAERILDEYGNKLLRLAYSYLHNMSDAEDILQDTLIQFLKNTPTFESKNHELAWLLRVAANLSKNKIRHESIRRADDVDELAETLAAEHRGDLSFVWDAVKALPQKYREAIHLFYYEGCSTAQIAGILQKTESTVRSDLRSGRIALKELLKEAYDFEQTV